MVVLERQFRALTEQTEHVSGVPPLSPEEVGQAVAVAISLWDATKRFLADMPPADRTKRESVRSALSLLRSAEHTIATTRDSVALLAKQGLRIRERGRLEDALEE